MSVSKFSSTVYKYIKESNPAPVHLWDPPYCGELDIRVSRDGQWYYNKSPINRKRVVKLFSNILKKEGNEYFLVTPVEKIKIIVDDVPFIIVDIEVNKREQSQEISFLTNIFKFVMSTKHHDNIIGAYPNRGYFVKPHWKFTDNIKPNDYLESAKNWVSSGAQIIGGCCGIGVEEIKALSILKN